MPCGIEHEAVAAAFLQLERVKSNLLGGQSDRGSRVDALATNLSQASDMSPLKAVR
jgi:hypothetical protein